MEIKINPDIFRAYDIRGVFPEEINEEVAYLVGGAFVIFLSGQRKLRKLNIVVGRDNRLSSPSLFRSLARGITEQGANVIDIGLSPTPMLYFSVAHFKYDGGIEISASHLSSEYNGFKLVREKAIPVSEKSGIREIKNLVLKGRFKKENKGKIIKKKVLKEYIRFNLKDFNLKLIKPLKIVIDTANAVPGVVIPEMFKKIPGKIYHLFQKLDGNFPNHSPDPHVKENLRELQKQVLNKKADLGIAFDGDGDRVIFVDEKGEIIGGDLIAALIAIRLLKSNPGEKIFYDLRSSKIVKEVIEKAGGKVVMGRLGHSFIKEQMRKENILFAGEFNGHYYLSRHYFCETPFFVIYKILEEISKTGKSLSELIKPFKKYFRSEEINFRVENKVGKIRELEKRYKNGKISHLDGIRIDFSDWWFNVRPSHTENLLRLNLEAKTKKLLEEKRKELLTLIKKLP